MTEKKEMTPEAKRILQECADEALEEALRESDDAYFNMMRHHRGSEIRGDRPADEAEPKKD